jgi:hypothetical protein
MKRGLKLVGLLSCLAMLYACQCPAPQVAEKAAAQPAPALAPAEPDCCKKLENELSALKMEVNALKRQLDAVKVEASEAKEAADKAIAAANRAEEAAKRAETAAQKAERIFEKGLKKK